MKTLLDNLLEMNTKEGHGKNIGQKAKMNCKFKGLMKDLNEYYDLVNALGSQQQTQQSGFK